MPYKLVLITRNILAAKKFEQYAQEKTKQCKCQVIKLITKNKTDVSAKFMPYETLTSQPKKLFLQAEESRPI